MILILISIFLMATAFYVAPCIIRENNEKKGIRNFCIIASLFFAVKIFFAGVYYGHSTDINCFWGWSEMLAESGLGNFYASDSFTDYPPGYMYVLNFIGLLRSIFNVGDTGYLILLKLPAIICDMVTGYLIYKISAKRFSEKSSLILSSLYMINPAVVINSSLWGQVDSIHTLGIIIVFLMLCNKKLIQSFFVFAVCTFIKPQSLIFTPVLLFSVAEYVFLPEFSQKRLFKVIFGGLGAIMTMVIMALPFGLSYVIKQYVSTID